MTMITPQNQASLVPVLDSAVLKEVEGFEGQRFLFLRAANPTKDELKGFVQYTTYSTYMFILQ